MERGSLPRTPDNEPTTRAAPRETLWGFIGTKEDPARRWVLLSFGLLVVANVLSYFTGSANLLYLEATKFQPWGVVTSIGLYDSAYSTAALPFLALLWFLLNTRVSSPERKRRSLLLIFGSAYAAVLANVIWMFSRSPFTSTEGVSGFEVAAGGIMLVFAVANLLSLRFCRLPNMIQLRTTDKEEMKWLLGGIYTMLAAIMVSSWFTLIELSGASINTEVHVMALTFGVGLGVVYELALILKSNRPLASVAFQASKP